MLQIHLVLHEFDDTEQQFRVAQPAEHIFKGREVLVLHTPCHTMAERREHHDGYVWRVVFYTSCNVEDIIVLCRRHTDHQVYIAVEHLFPCLCLGRYLDEAWREAKTQFGIFREYLLVYASVVLQHEGIVWVGNEKDIADAFLHQVNEGSIFQLHCSVCVLCVGRNFFHPQYFKTKIRFIYYKVPLSCSLFNASSLFCVSLSVEALQFPYWETTVFSLENSSFLIGKLSHQYHKPRKPLNFRGLYYIRTLLSDCFLLR